MHEDNISTHSELNDLKIKVGSQSRKDFEKFYDLYLTTLLKSINTL